MTDVNEQIKNDRGILAVDDRNGATCVSTGLLTPSAVELGRALFNAGTQYICEPNTGKSYIADLLKDPQAAIHIYTPPKRNGSASGLDA